MMSWNYNDDDVNGQKVFLEEKKCLQMNKLWESVADSLMFNQLCIAGVQVLGR